MSANATINMIYGDRQRAYLADVRTPEMEEVHRQGGLTGNHFCWGCVEALPEEAFGRVRGRLQSRCKDCQAGRGPTERAERRLKMAARSSFKPRSSRILSEVRNRALLSATCALHRSSLNEGDLFGGLTKEEIINQTLHVFDDAYLRTEQTGEQHEVDHLVEIADGGLHHPSNLWAIPRSIHQRKTRQSIKVRTHGVLPPL